MEMLREKHRGLELKIVEMIRHGQENVSIADKLHRWTRALLLTADAADLPACIVEQVQHQFLVPQAAIRVWGGDAAFADRPFAKPVSADAQTFATSLTQPYCGINSGFEAVSWLGEPTHVASMALIPLRLQAGSEAATPAFGMLVLASPDPTRFSIDMGTDFLVRIGEIASASLSRLLPRV